MHSGSNDNTNKRKRSIGLTFALNGLLQIIKTERNFQIHVLSAIVIIITGFYVHLTAIEWSIILLVIGFVLVAEITNTAIEKTIDYLKPDIHPSAKLIKDIAAGAVLMAAIIAAIIGLIIFLPKLYNMYIL